MWCLYEGGVYSRKYGSSLIVLSSLCFPLSFLPPSLPPSLPPPSLPPPSPPPSLPPPLPPLLRGNAEHHHLGHGIDDHVRRPKLVEALAALKVVDVSVGLHHCLALVAAGDVFGWGRNAGGEVDPSEDAVPVPTLIPAASKQGVVTLCCGVQEVGGALPLLGCMQERASSSLHLCVIVFRAIT